MIYIIGINIERNKNMDMQKSNAHKNLYDTDLGKKLWQFLNEEKSLIKMEAASDIERPALEPLQKDLKNIVDKYDLDTNKLISYKQLIGVMCKDILLRNGFQLVKTGVKIRKEIFFKTAALYVKK